MAWPFRAREHKYGAKPVTVDGIRFASSKEAQRYLALRLLERAGAIRDLELQPRFPLIVNGTLVATYVADFRYHDVIKNCQVVEDAKGVRLQLYLMKVKLLRALHGIEVVEV